MNPLQAVTGQVAVLNRSDIDTDQILPKQFLTRTERNGYGEFLFYDWMKDPRFELHRVPKAQILIAGANFGCGSSREHAVWALHDYGIRAVIAPSFGDIFFTNAINSGLAPVSISAEAIASLTSSLALTNELTVDIERLEIRHPRGMTIAFFLDNRSRMSLISGLDPIARTLLNEDAIARFEAAYKPRFDLTALA